MAEAPGHGINSKENEKVLLHYCNDASITRENVPVAVVSAGRCDVHLALSPFDRPEQTKKKKREEISRQNND